MSRVTPKQDKGSNMTTDFTLAGHMLIAMPTIRDNNFRRSVVYLCAHNENGAMGIIINQCNNNLRFSELIKQLGINLGENDISLKLDELPVYTGGPVDKSRGFVLHSSDYFQKEATVQIQQGVCLTASVNILKAIVEGTGPKQSLFALGYAGWSAGQLDKEILNNGWLHSEIDPDLIFETDRDQRYVNALTTLGIDPMHLSSFAGQA